MRRVLIIHRVEKQIIWCVGWVELSSHAILKVNQILVLYSVLIGHNGWGSGTAINL